uniref:Protein furry n=1 Tax=Trichobilharzia regenti TaxID=157069 RepID=A0AA85ITT2_TRIRE|nr:unnamed protein product [Trichobilharzia regenti]
MRLNEDPAYENLISAFGVAAEFALPSLVSTLSLWYRSQHSSGKYYQLHQLHCFASPNKLNENDIPVATQRPSEDSHIFDVTQATSVPPNKSVKCASESASLSKSNHVFPPDASVIFERRDLAIDIIFCHVILAVLRQLPFHPGHNDVIELILEQCFRRFNYREDLQPKNSENINLVADLYAEIVGLLFQSRFALVRHKFMGCLNDLRSKENSPNNRASIVSLIMGMKFFRVKMHPIEDFVNCFNFLQELGQYFLEVKEIEIKHVLSDLFVEILLPVAAVARQEVNIPALKTFVENLYPTSLELASKKKHVPALFPLVTCLLCVGTKPFFLNNWTNFLSICLSHLKNRTSKVALVSLQSLSCILWVYIVRIKGEKHTETQNKLHTIINSLFPKNQKIILPKDAPINIFVRIIQFIAHEKLDFAMKEVIIDRLGVNGSQKTLVMPERINVGLCAFLLIAHGLQQKDGEPPMPQQCIGAGGVGGGFRQAVIKRSFHGTNLNEALGSLLGIQSYLVPVRRAFELILRQLDTQVCRTMMLPKQEVTQKEFDELMTADRKPKLDLLKTCVACIPRLLPIDMTKQEILEILAKVCLHVDEDVRKMAQQAMANLIVELPAYRVKTIQVFIHFIQKICLKTLFHLLNNWKLALQKDGAVTPNMAEKSALYEAEGFALVMLCSCRSITRRLAVYILRKCRALLNLIQSATYDPTLKQSNDVREMCCIDVLDRSVPMVLKRLLPILPLSERSALSSVSTLDFSVFTERSHPVWFSGSTAPTYSPIVLPANCLNNNQYSGLMSGNDVQHNETRFGNLSSRHDLNRPNYHNNNSPCGGDSVTANISEKSKLDETSVQETFTKIVRPSISGLLATSRTLDSQNVQTSKPCSSTTPVHRRPSQYNQQVQHTQQAYIMQPTQERVVLADVWGTCLSVVFSSSSLPASCPMAIKSAWSILFQRISALFPLIDPSAQIAENRASSLLRTASKKPANEREQFVPLWHNYVVVGCCIAPSSTGIRISKPPDTCYQPELRVQKHSPDCGTKRDTLHCRDSSRSPTQPDEIQNQTTDSNANSSTSRATMSNSPCSNWPNSTDLKHSASYGKVNARDLVKLLVPLLRCEQSEIRDSAIGGLGRINPAAFRDVLEDLQPLLKESFDRKQENLRRRRRRDGLRSALIKILSLMAQTGVFAHPESNSVTPQGALIPQLLDYIDGMRSYLESVSDQLLSPVSHTHTSSASLNILASMPSASSSQQVGTSGSNTSNQVSGSISSGSVVNSLPTPLSSGPSVSEAYLLNEIRLHFCIFTKELIRRLPKQSRANLLPPTLRHQLFILLSHWSAHYDHVMGTYFGSEGPVPIQSCFNNSNVDFTEHTTGSSGAVGVSPSNEISPGFIGPHHQLVNDNFLQSVNNLSLNNVTPSGSTDSTANLTIPLNQASHSPTFQQKVSNNEQTEGLDSLEYCLWIDLIWLSNQAMAALGAAVPGSDSVYGSCSDRSNGTSCSNVCTPSPGYVLRWISGLLVARDTALSSSPWLWFCPITSRGLLHNTLNPGGASLCGNSHTRSRTIAAGGGRRLDSLLRQLGEETLVLLLDFNIDNSGLFNWVVDQCYTSSNISLSTACFECICLIMSNIPNFTCDHTVLITLCLIFIDHPSRFLSDRAFYLLRVLYRRFFIERAEILYKQVHSVESKKPYSDKDSPQSQSSTCNQPNCECTQLSTYLRINKLFYRSFNYWLPCEVVRQFAAQHPDYTLTIFSEVSRRLENAREGLRVPLLHLLSPWFVNVELVDLIEGEVFDSPDHNLDMDDDFSYTEKENDPFSMSNYEKPSDIVDVSNSNNNTSDQQQQHVRKDNPEYRIRLSKRYKRSKSLLNAESLRYDPDDTDADSDNINHQRSFKSLSLLRMRARQAMMGENTDLHSPRSFRSSNLCYNNSHFRNGCKATYATNNAALWSTVPPTLRSKGWGSKQATEFVLTNLFYLTLRLADCPTSSEALKQLWITLIRHRSANLRVIVRYLIIVTSLAPGTLLIHVKRILAYLASEQPESVIGELMVEMQTIDGIGLIVEPSPNLPFFHVIASIPQRKSNEDIQSSKVKSFIKHYSSSKMFEDSLKKPTSHTLPSQDGLVQPDAELIALGLDSAHNSNTTTRTRTLRSAVGGKYDCHNVNGTSNTSTVTPAVTMRPKSATCQPCGNRSSKDDPQIEMRNTGKHSTSISPASGTANDNLTSMSETPGTQKSHCLPLSSNCQLVEGSDGEPEIDVDTFEGLGKRGLPLDDKYATLRAKDIANLLIQPIPKDFESSDSVSDCDLPNVSHRGTTFPNTYAAQERSGFSSTLPNQVNEISRLQMCGRTLRQPKYLKEFRERRFKWFSSSKNETISSLAMDAHLHSASLPPNLTDLPPLPLALPTSISTILSLSSRGSTGSNTCILPVNLSSADKRSNTGSDKMDNKPNSVRIRTCSNSVGKISFDCNSKPLPMPINGGYQAPLGSWLSEPLVIGGSVVFSGGWPPAGPRSPLVLILAGGLTQCRDIRIDWTQHLPVMLLGVFLGIDHCRALIQEESKQLLVSLLDQVCPHHDALHLLRLELEANLRRLAHPSALPGPRVQDYRLTFDGGPYCEKFNLVIDPFMTIESDNLFSSPIVSSRTVKYDDTEQFKNMPSTEKEPDGDSHTTSLDLLPLKDIDVTASLAASPSSPNCSPPMITQLQTNPTPLIKQGRLSDSMFSLTSTATLIPRHQDVNVSEPQYFNDTTMHKSNIVNNSNNQTIDVSEKHVLRSKTLSNATRPSSVYTSSQPSKTATTNHVQTSNYHPLKMEKSKKVKESDLKLLEEAIQQLRCILLDGLGQALWTWEDFNMQRNSFNSTIQSTYQYECNQIFSNEKPEIKESTIKTKMNMNSLEQLVKLVARILSLSEAGSEEAENCLQCLHGPPHDHNKRGVVVDQDDNCKDTWSDHSNYCLVARLSQAALNTGLSCPSRHYASRSLQIHRALGAHLDKKSLSQLLARLGETVSDGNEEMQGYVAELFVTQEAAIHHLKTRSDSLLEPVSTLAPDPASPSSSSISGNGRKSIQIIISNRKSSVHLNTVVPVNDSPTLKSDQANSPSSERVSSSPSSIPSTPSHFTKKSHTSVTSSPKLINQNNSVCLLPAAERADLIVGIFWTGVLLLESDFEHEYSVGLKLLSLVIPSVCASNPRHSSTAHGSRINLSDRAQKMLNQLRWNPYFPGILSLVIKGCSSPNLVDQACRLLIILIPFLTHPLVVPCGRMGLPIQISLPIVLLTLMPMLTTAWDEDPSTSVPINPYEMSSEQFSFLQGGFLGRGVSSSLNIIPRALGSWTSCYCTAHTSFANPNSTVASNSKMRTDSVGLFGNYSSNSLGVFSGAESTLNLNMIGTGSINRDVNSIPKSPVLRPKNPVCIQAAESLAQAALKIDPVQFSNLALVLRLYASGNFSKDVDQWSKCVICYLLEGCGSNAPRMLKHINMLLTSGPPCLQLPLLKVAYLFLQQVDINQPDLGSSLQNFITSIIGQFLGTNLWSYVIPILQVTVSRSAVLSTVPETPAYTLPGLDPSGSGRILDFAVAAAAVAVPLPESEPPRLELAGPVLDFTFNVFQEAPLLAPEFAPSSSSNANLENISKVDTASYDFSPLKGNRKDYIDASDIGLTETFVSASGGWSKPGSCQSRLREKLYRLVGCYGMPAQQCISAPRSPSVIFSQSTETLDPQLSVHSSSETTSVVDISNSDDIRLDDTSSGEQTAVFRDLDTYLDAQLMNINFLGVPDCRLASTSASMSEDEPRRPWGVRGQAITCHFDLNGDGSESIANETFAGLSRPIQTIETKIITPAESDYLSSTYHQSRTNSLPQLTAFIDNRSDGVKHTDSKNLNTNRYSTITISNNYTDCNVDNRYSTGSRDEQQLHMDIQGASSSLIWKSFTEESNTAVQLDRADNDYMSLLYTTRKSDTLSEEDCEMKSSKTSQTKKRLNVNMRNSRAEHVSFDLGDGTEEVEGEDSEVENTTRTTTTIGGSVQNYEEENRQSNAKGILVSHSHCQSHKNAHTTLQSNAVHLPSASIVRFASIQVLNNSNCDYIDYSAAKSRPNIYFPRCYVSCRNELGLRDKQHIQILKKSEHQSTNHRYRVCNTRNSLLGQIKRSASTSELSVNKQQYILIESSDGNKSFTNSLLLSPLSYRSEVNSNRDRNTFGQSSSSLSSSRSSSPKLSNNEFKQPISDLIITDNNNNGDNDDNNNTSTVKAVSSWTCSSSLISPQSIPFSPSLSVSSSSAAASVHSSHSSLHYTETGGRNKKSNHYFPAVTKMHRSTSDSSINCSGKKIIYVRRQQQHEHGEQHSDQQQHHKRHSAHINENAQNFASSECASLNKIVSVQSSTSLCNWRNPLTTEQKWLELESILHSTTCSRLNEQQMLMCMLNELPQSYQELVSRYIIALKQTINLSGYSWTESNRFSSLAAIH